MKNLGRFLRALLPLAALSVLLAATANAQDYDTAISQLSQLQGLAGQYITENGTQDDPINLTLSFTRTGDYNTSTWQMTAGTRDPDFENYVQANAPELIELQGMNSITLPDGQGVDFGHLLASMNLVYKGIPITGSWGGDCMQLAQAYQGQASDATGYMGLMQQTFGIADDGSNSFFGDQDLVADLDSVVVGSSLKADSSIADALQQYYASVTAYDRCYSFIALTFGTVDTGNTDSFRTTVYDTLVKDSGMQLLMYIGGMWGQDGWTVNADAEPALQGAAYVFADYLAATVNNEKVKSDSGTLMMTMDGSALVNALTALGYGDAASAAQGAESVDTPDSTSSSDVGGKVDTALTDATQTIKTSFNVTVFQIILIALGVIAVGLLITCVVLLVRRR